MIYCVRTHFFLPGKGTKVRKVKFFSKIETNQRIIFAGSTLMKIVYRSKEDFFYGTPKRKEVVDNLRVNAQLFHVLSVFHWKDHLI